MGSNLSSASILSYSGVNAKGKLGAKRQLTYVQQRLISIEEKRELEPDL